MRNYIILNGQNSNSISGLLIQSLAPISKPQMRTQTEEIDGRPGDIVTDLGFSSYDKEITIGLYGNFDINEVIAYFNSQGVVTFSNEPDKYYNYQIYDQIDFERLVRYRTATVTMHCQPFKYSTIEQPDIMSPTDNLLTIPDVTKTANGVTVKAANGTLTVSGTATAATEVYVPISALTLQAGSYTLTATASGQNPTNCSIRMIGSAPSNSDSFGGNYLPLVQGTTTLSGTLSASKTYNYIWFYINAGTAMGFTLNISVEDEAAKVVSDEGTNLVLEGSQLAPFNTLDLKGNTSQNGTPTPSAPLPVKVVTGENVVNVCGKNLFNTYAVVKGRLDNGVIGYVSSTTSLSANDNSITFTVDAAWRGCISEAIPVKPNTEYHMKATSSGAAIGASSADYYSEEGWISRQVVPQASLEYSFTTPANCKYVRISWQTSQVGTATISNPQLELGSSATAFEAFSGQSYEVNLGKNLLDIQATPSPDSNISQSGITYTIGADGTIATSGVSTSTYKNLRFDLTLDAGTYFFSGCPEGGSTDGYSFVVQVGSTLNWDYGSGSTFTLSEKTTVRAYVVRLGGSNGVNMNGKVFKPMIVKGSTSTSFAPYFTPIELCKIGDYQDYLYKSEDKWYVHKAVGKAVYSSSDFTLANNDQYTNVRYAQFTKQEDNIQYNNYDHGGITNIFTAARNMGGAPSGGWDSFNAEGEVYNNATRTAWWCSFAKTTSLDTIKSKLDGMAAYYVLATPVDEEITNEALIEQLDNIYYHAHAYKGRTHVSSLAADGNVPHIIAAAVAQNNDGVVTNSGNYFSKPRLTIYGEGEIGVYLNGIQIFQIALGSEGYITIDTAALEAYKDTTDNLKNRLVTGDYENFALRPGENQLSFSGSVTKCVVENYSRWL